MEFLKFMEFLEFREFRWWYIYIYIYIQRKRNICRMTINKWKWREEPFLGMSLYCPHLQFQTFSHFLFLGLSGERCLLFVCCDDDFWNFVPSCCLILFIFQHFRVLFFCSFLSLCFCVCQMSLSHDQVRWEWEQTKLGNNI